MNILLADNQPLFRQALIRYAAELHPDIRILEAANCEEAQIWLESSETIDLAVLDQTLPGVQNEGQGGSKGKNKKKHTPLSLCAARPEGPPCVLLCAQAKEEDVQKIIDSGAFGVFPRTLSGRSFIQAVNAVLSGHVYKPDKSFYCAPKGNVVPSQSAEHHKTLPQNSAFITPVRAIRLTPREKEVLTYLLKGASNKEIASAMDLQIVTVKLHVRGVCRKLGARNRTQAALMARQYGFSG